MKAEDFKKYKKLFESDAGSTVSKPFPPTSYGGIVAIHGTKLYLSRTLEYMDALHKELKLFQDETKDHSFDKEIKQAEIITQQLKSMYSQLSRKIKDEAVKDEAAGFGGWAGGGTGGPGGDQPQ
jgi:hypothetical protein